MANNNTFEVLIKRNSLGLGFSIMGGPDAPHPHTNLIRIKKIFPLQPAWESGQLKAGDVILKVDDASLISLGLRQALDVLRTSQPVTRLSVYRPPENRLETLFRSNLTNPVNRSYSCNGQDVISPSSAGPTSLGIVPCSRPEPMDCHEDLDDSVQSFGQQCQPVFVDQSPERDANQTWTYGQNPEPDTVPIGEFSLRLTKVNGSLGFTVCQTTDATVLRHSVKALVKEPAISDGRIRPGDKLISANGSDCSQMSHAELISFLRKCPPEVKLTLYRDASRSQTPVSPTGNGMFAKASKATMSHPNLPSFLSSAGSGKRLLRYEAKEMVKSLQASRTSLDSSSRNGSNASSGSAAGRIRRLGRPYSPKSPLTVSTSAPLANTKHPLLLREIQSFEDGSVIDQEPTVESPLSPFPTTATTASIENKMDGLNIEELPPTPPPQSTHLGGPLSDNYLVEEVPPAFRSSSSEKKPVPRPRNLDLLAKCKTHQYVFQPQE